MELPTFAVTSFLVQFIYLLVTVAAVVGLLRWFDKAAGISFKKDVWDKIDKDPRALALYHGLRFLAVCYVAGQFLS